MEQSPDGAILELWTKISEIDDIPCHWAIAYDEASMTLMPEYSFPHGFVKLATGPISIHEKMDFH